MNTFLQLVNESWHGPKNSGNLWELISPHNAFFPDVNSHELYTALLEKYLAIAPFLLPKDTCDPGNQPVLRHPGIL